MTRVDGVGNYTLVIVLHSKDLSALSGYVRTKRLCGKDRKIAFD